MSAWHVGRPPLQRVKCSFLKSRGEAHACTQSARAECPLSPSVCLGSAGSWLLHLGFPGRGAWRLAAVASLAGEHGGFRSCNTWASRWGCPALEHRLTACGIFPDRELNLCLLHWQADCYPPNCQGSPRLTISHAQVSGGWCSVVQTPKGCAPPEMPLMETEHPYDPAVPPADVSPKETKTLTQIEMCTPVFIAALFTVNQDVEIT